MEAPNLYKTAIDESKLSGQDWANALPSGANTPPPSPAQDITNYAEKVAEKVYNKAWQSFSSHMKSSLPVLPWENIPEIIEEKTKLQNDPYNIYKHGLMEPTDKTYFEGKNDIISNTIENDKRGSDYQEIFRKLKLLEEWNNQDPISKNFM